jgi:hypothetical protein
MSTYPIIFSGIHPGEWSVKRAEIIILFNQANCSEVLLHETVRYQLLVNQPLPVEVSLLHNPTRLVHLTVDQSGMVNEVAYYHAATTPKEFLEALEAGNRAYDNKYRRYMEIFKINEEKKKEWSIHRNESHSGLCVKGEPVICIHTHWKTNDLVTGIFNKWILGRLQILKKNRKIQAFLKFIEK